VVFIHGSANPYHVWDANFSTVADAGYRVVRYDRYGVGYSDRPRGLRYNADLFDRQLLELVGKLNVKTPLTLAGFSLGGNISVVFAERHPEMVKGLILVSPGGLPQPMTGSMRLFNLLRLPGVGEYFIRLAGKKMSNPDDQGLDLYDQALLPGYVERLRGLERYKGALSASLSTIRYFPILDLESSYRVVGDSRRPVLCIWGKEDRVVPFASAEKLKAAIPQVELLAVDQAGHASHYEKRDVVNAAILDFLRRLAPIS
jgi:pimeloyl-ACP methyl ester carboxylesterase